MSLGREALQEYANRFLDVTDNVFETDCDTIEYMLDNCTITVNPENRFFVEVNCDGIANPVHWHRANKYSYRIDEMGLSAGVKAWAFLGGADVGHTCPKWEDILSLGIKGLYDRAQNYIKRPDNTPEQNNFYGGVIRVYAAALRFMKRAADVAEKCGKQEMSQGILYLTENTPTTLFGAMQTSIIYYVLQHMFEGTNLRSLGRLDKLFYPFYIKEERETADKMLCDFINEIDRLRAPANIPFALGGTDADGNSLVNELTYKILEIYKNSSTTNTKFHLLCADNTPESIVESAFEGVKNGKNSVVFMSDKKVIESLEKIGAQHSDAVNYHIVGCYECGADEETTCSCNGRINIQKAVEYTLLGGVDMVTGEKVGLDCTAKYETFDQLFDEFKRQVAYLCDCAVRIVDVYEEHYDRIHAAPFFSGVMPTAMEKGGDIYCDNSAKYCNSSINALGLATAVDSLAAIRKIVFEDKTLTLSELTEILKNNWAGQERLRLTVKNKFPKYGMGDGRVDILAKETVDTLVHEIGGRPNKKGGVYRLGLFSIDWRWEHGKLTAASADGRLRGETISQNTSASFGADRLGATAHLISAAQIDASNTPNGAIVDIDLHASSVVGKNGTNALVSTLKGFFDMGGFAVHYNVLNTDVLKAAKLDPAAYPNLQVRLCGWNVLFANLSEREKDEFIARSVKG